jgi:hypothetical protein
MTPTQPLRARILEKNPRKKYNRRILTIYFARMFLQNNSYVNEWLLFKSAWLQYKARCLLILSNLSNK